MFTGGQASSHTEDMGACVINWGEGVVFCVCVCMHMYVCVCVCVCVCVWAYAYVCE